MATNSKNINSTNGLQVSKFQMGIGMVSMLVMLSAATIATLEVRHQNQSVESQSNEAQHIIIASRNQAEKKNQGGQGNL